MLNSMQKKVIKTWKEDCLECANDEERVLFWADKMENLSIMLSTETRIKNLIETLGLLQITAEMYREFRNESVK